MFNCSNARLLLTSVVGLLAFTAIDAGFSKANAMNFYFVPVAPSENANLDLDPIFDIQTDTNGLLLSPSGGQPVSFDIFADITGFTAPGTADEVSFTWTTTIDSTELSFVSATANTRVSLAGPAIQQVQRVSYLTVNPGIRPHDGVNDFGITLTGVDLYNGGVRVGSIAVTAFDAPSVNNLNLPGNEFNQVVEVQSVPEPLTLLGAGTAMGFGAFFKRKLKASKSSKN